MVYLYPRKFLKAGNSSPVNQERGIPMEKQGKSRKPLIIGVIVALVVLAALVALLLTQCFGGNPNETSAPSTEGTTAPPVLTYELYWNADRKDYIATGEDVGLTLREPKDDGYYHVLFAYNGEQIDLPVIDRRTLLKVDSADMMQLVFDENGVVIDAIFVDDLPVEILGETGWYVQSMGGTTVKINSSKSFDGMDDTFKTNDQTQIYDMSGKSEYIGAPASLQKEDRIYTVANSEGDITHIFIFEREGIKSFKMQYCEYCEKEVQWENWFTGDKLPISNGHYWLDKDITMSNTAQIKESNTVCLDLNGHFVQGRSGWRIITTFNAASHLAIFDYSEEKTGTMKSAGDGIDQGGCVWARFGTVHLYGGTYISGGQNDIYGGAVNCGGGTILNIYDGVVIKGGTTKKGCAGGALGVGGVCNMYGGIIEGGIANANVGGNVLVNGADGVFNMYGGVIRNGQSRGSNGGNVAITGKGTMNLYGGTIANGAAYQNDKGSNGVSGFYVGANSTFNMYGGVIYGGSCHKYNGERIEDSRDNIFIVNATFNMSGGRVYGGVYSIDTDGSKTPVSTIRLSGSAQIYGNADSKYGVSWNKASKFIVGNMWNGAKVGVTAKGVFTDVVKEGTEKYFYSDNPVMEVIRNDEGKLELYFDESKYIVQHCICGDPNGTGTKCAEDGHKQETWRPYMDNDAAPWDGGFWYLLQDVTIAGGHGYSDTFSTGTGVIGFGISTPVQVALDLNGHSLKSQSGHRLFRLESTAAHTLIITDTSETKDGKLIPRAGTGNTNHGMAIWMRGDNNKLYFYNGIVDGTEGYVATNNGGALALAGSCYFYGGTIMGNGSDQEGTVVRTGSAKVYLKGDVKFVNQSGRTDGFWLNSGKKLFIEGGNVQIDNLYMAAGSRLVISGMGENASIGVDAGQYGRLTSTDASAYLQYFHAVEEGESVKLNDDKTLVLVGPNDEGLNEEGAHPTHCACGKAEADCPLDSHENIQGEWLPWDGKGTISESGNYYLTQDVPNSTQYWLGSYQNTSDNPMVINLCLHGHSIDSNYRALGIGTYLTVNLMNCSDTEAVLSGMAANNDQGGVIHIHNASSTLNMFDGITLKPAQIEGRINANGGAVNCGGVFNLYGGTVYGGPVGGLKSSNGTYSVLNGNGGAIFVGGSGAFNMYGGEVYGAELYSDNENKVTDEATGAFKARGLGGAIYTSGGNVTIEGGSIYGGKAGDGGAIFAGSGIVTISGGTHYAGYATFGGGFMKANGSSTTVNLTGGVIDGNNPLRESDTINAGGAGGGAFMLWDSTMTVGGDAVIKNCYTSATGGAIRVASNKSKLTVTGTPVILENGKGTKADHVVQNVYLVDNEEIYVNNLGAEAKVGITMATAGVFTDCEVAEEVITNGNFVSDVADYEVKMTTSKTLALVAKGTTGDIVDPQPPVPEVIVPEPEPDATHADHCLCNATGDVEGCDHTKLTGWQPLTAQTITASGNYYLTSNQLKTMTIGNGTDAIEVTICLNGQNINISDWRAIRVTANATLNLVNCKPSEIGGIVKSVGENNGHSGVVMLQTNGVLNVYNNVTLTRIGDNTIKSAGIVGVFSGTLNVYGGTIKGTNVTGNGGAIQVAGGTVNIYAGTVTGGQAQTGGNINANTATSVVNIYGGVIENGVSKGGHGGNISLQNGAEINILGGTVQNGQSLPVDGASATNQDAQDKNGGNLSVVDTNADDKEGTMTIGGTAQILNGNGDRGGNIFVHSGKLVIKDTAVISGGTARNKGWGGGCDDVHINGNALAFAAVSGAPKIEEIRLGNNNLLDVTGLTKEASIGISLGSGNKKAVFTAPVDAELVQAFTSQRFDVAQNADGALELVDKTFGPVYHCVCGAETEQGKHCATCDHDVVAWNPWTVTDTAPYLDGYWYIPYDLDLKTANHKYSDTFSTATAMVGYKDDGSGAMVDADVNVYIDLNGATLRTRPGHRGFRMDQNGSYQRTLTITDTSANKTGKIIAGTIANSDQGMLIWSRNSNQKITIWGGTLDASNVATKEAQGGAGINASCNVYMYGGTLIAGNTLSTKGDGIWARDIYLYNDAKVLAGAGSNGALCFSPNYKLIIDSSWTFQSEPLTVRTLDADGCLLIAGTITTQQAQTFKVYGIPSGYALNLDNDGISVVAGSGNLGGGTPDVPDVPDVPVDPNHPTHCVCGGSDEQCSGHKDVEGGWKAWDGKSNITESGNYYLTADVTESTQYWLGAVDNANALTINLCLNGHSIDSKWRVFAIGPATTVSLMNCSDTDSVLTGMCADNDNSGVLRLHAATSTLNMYDGIVVMQKEGTGRTAKSGGTVGVYGVFNMYGGEIYGGTAGWGGNLAVSGTAAVFNMYDGVIANGTATNKNDHGGNLYVHNGAQATITGGVIADGKTTGTGDANGGNIAISGGANTKLTIGGDAVIIGGKSNRAGNLFVHTGTVRIEGNAQILDGTAICGADTTNGGYANSVLVNGTLTGDHSFTVAGSVIIDSLYLQNPINVGELTDQAVINLQAAKALVATKNAVEDAQAACFSNGTIGYNLIKNADGKLEFVAKEAVTYCLCGLETELGKTCEECGSEVLTWQPWTMTDLAPFLPGNWYLTNGLNLGKGAVHNYPNHGIGNASTALVGYDAEGNPINENVVVNVNLNGFAIVGRANNRLYRMEPNGDYTQTLTITDTSEGGNGKIITRSSGDNANIGMGIWVRNNKQTFNLYAGTIDASECATTSNGAAIASEGYVNLYGGTVIGGTAAKGGAVSTNGNMTMSGNAAVIGGEADQGGAIRVKNATLTMSDNAMVTGGLGKVGGGGVFMEGSAKLVMSDYATIAGNGTMGFGGGVYVGSVEASVTLSGAVKITDNYNQSGSDDLWLWKVSDPTITIGEGGLSYDAEDVGESALIGIGTQVGYSQDAAAPTVIAGPANLTAKAAACFYTNEDGWMITVEEAGLCVRQEGAGLYHCVCGDPSAEITNKEHPCYNGHTVVEWKAWELTNVAPFLPGNWYLAEDLDLTGTTDYSYTAANFAANTAVVGRDAEGNMINEDIVVNVDLNGKTLTGESGHRLYRLENADYAYTLNITDTVGGGKLIPTSNANNQNQGMAVWLRGGSYAKNTVNILGIEFIGENATVKQTGTAGRNGGMFAVEDGTLNIFGSIINGTKMPASHTTEKLRCAGSAIAASGTANVNIYDATIYGTTASNGATLFFSGAEVVVNIRNSTVYAGQAAFGGGCMKVQNKAVVNMISSIIDGNNPKLAAGAINCNNNGGGVFVEGATLNMSGNAKIINCSAKAKGGAVVLNGSAAVLTMTDHAEISGNSLTNHATNGGGVHVNTIGAKVILSGYAKITGNTNTSGASNLCITVASAAVELGENGLGEAASIGVTMQVPGAFTNGAAKEYLANFTADNADAYEITVGEGDVLELTAK